ncbi:hypothetical protein FRC01_003934, partial [Tulasnella sp. 417]
MALPGEGDQSNSSNATDGNANPGVPRSTRRTNIDSIPSQYKIPKHMKQLEGSSNWDSWSFCMKNVFNGGEAWDIVRGAEPMPDGTDQDALDIWIAKSKAAQITINLSITETCYPLVEEATSAPDAWKALSEAYKSKGLLTAFYHRIKLITYRFTEALSFGPQIDALRQLRKQQVSGGIPCEDWDFAICLLAALPESYSVVKQSIL